MLSDKVFLPRFSLRLSLGHWALCIAAVLSSGCATVPVAPTVTPPVISWEEKLTWMMRLEDQRILRDPNPRSEEHTSELQSH